MRTIPRTPISPRARRALRQHGVDADAIRGTGPNGRIVEADVLRTANAPCPRPVRPVCGYGGINVGPAVHAARGEGPGTRAVVPINSLSAMRRAVAAKVTASFATVPHFYLRSQVDVTSLVQLRQQNIEAFEKCYGVRPGLTDFLLRAMAIALSDCPQANRIWQNDGIVQLPSVDVGLVVAVGDGLMVPIIHQADRLGVLGVARQRIRLTEAVRSGKAPADILQGGATSLTNLGKHRVDEFAPIISPPQSGMLAIGRVAERPLAFEGRLCLRQTLHVTLAVDHRVMDGVPAAEFLDRVVDLLERPFRLLCEMPAAELT